MENQDYSQQNGGQPLQSTPNQPAVGTDDYWNESLPRENWQEDAVPPTPVVEQKTELIVETTVAPSATPVPPVETAAVPPVETTPVPPPFTQQQNADIEGIYEAVNSVFEKVEKFQDIIKIQNKTIDRFSKGLILEARKPLLMELCDLYETVMFGIDEDDKALSERYPAEERCQMLRAKLDELLQFIQCTLEDNQVEIKRHPNGTDELAIYQTVTGRELTDDISRFSNFDSTTNAIYVTDRSGFVVKTTEVNESGACKVVDHILRPEEVTKIVLNKN